MADFWDTVEKYAPGVIGGAIGGPAGALAADQVFGGEVTDDIGGAIGDVGSSYMGIGQSKFVSQPVQIRPFQSAPIEYGGDPRIGLEGYQDASRRSGAAFDAMMTGPSTVGSVATGNASLGQASFGDATYGDAYFGDLSLAAENQDLSNREYQTRQGDQAGSIQLMREAAMGQAPSQAQYLMQSGLDQALAAQQAQAGGARGQAALALAGGNAMANSANLQQQAYLQNAALRAQEMATARAGYGGLAEAQRAQDLQRLGYGNQMALSNAQFANQMSSQNAANAQQASLANAGWANDMSALNARLATDTSNSNASLMTNAALQNARMTNDVAMQNASMQNQYKLGVGNVGAAYGNMGLGYLNQYNDAYSQQLAADQYNQTQAAKNYYDAVGIGARSYDTAQEGNRQTAIANAGEQGKRIDNMIRAGTEVGTSIIQGIAGAK